MTLLEQRLDALFSPARVDCTADGTGSEIAEQLRRCVAARKSSAAPKRRKVKTPANEQDGLSFLARWLEAARCVGGFGSPKQSRNWRGALGRSVVLPTHSGFGRTVGVVARLAVERDARDPRLEQLHAAETRRQDDTGSLKEEGAEPCPDSIGEEHAFLEAWWQGDGQPYRLERAKRNLDMTYTVVFDDGTVEPRCERVVAALQPRDYATLPALPVGCWCRRLCDDASRWGAVEANDLGTDAAPKYRVRLDATENEPSHVCAPLAEAEIEPVVIARGCDPNTGQRWQRAFALSVLKLA